MTTASWPRAREGSRQPGGETRTNLVRNDTPDAVVSETAVDKQGQPGRRGNDDRRSGGTPEASSDHLRVSRN